MLHKKANSTEIFYDLTLMTTFFTTKCTKSDAPVGQCARASYSNLAKSCINPHDHVQHLQLNTLQPPRFFDNQLPVCVYENESRILMHFQAEPHIRILAREPNLVFSVAKKCFIDDQLFPGTQIQHFTV